MKPVIGATVPALAPMYNAAVASTVPGSLDETLVKLGRCFLP